MNDELPPLPKTPPYKTLFIVALALATIIFASLSIYFFSQSSKATLVLGQAKKIAASDAATKQKQIDDIAATTASELPYRSYMAPKAFGAITITFPKNWSSRVAEFTENNVQFNLSANPEFIKYKDDKPLAVALRVRLIKQTMNSYIDSFGDSVKSGVLHKSNVKVSGINGISLDGKYPDESSNIGFVHLVAVPLKEKVVVFTTEDSAFSSQFATILSQSKIIQ